MKIIFLDFDGVLNSQEFLNSVSEAAHGASHIDPELVAKLERLVRSTHARIVVSSSWRSIYTLPQLRRILAQAGAPAAARAIIDRTPSGMGSRGDEIQDWLDLESERKVIDPDHSIESFVILDDSNDMLPDQQPFMIHTNPQTGLTDENVDDAVSILGAP